MTNNGSTKTLKTKLILVFTILCMLSSFLLGFAACKDDEAVSDSTYSYTETTTDDGKIKNATFAIGSDKTDDSSFPITSATGWTKATDNSAASSAVNSGIVKLTEESWADTVKTLYSDYDFENYVENKFVISGAEGEEDKSASKTNINAAIKAEKGDDYTVTAADRGKYVADNFFKMPQKHAGENVDDYVYMLNNIRSDSYYERGTAQKLTSSSSVSLEKGKIYKLSVWVKTVNVEKNGANIRLVNSFSGSSQADYRISNVIANDWTQYSIYVKADADYDGTITLVLGLGYGDGASSQGVNYSEGTAFFDDVVFEEADAMPDGITANTLKYGSTDKIEATPIDVNGVMTCAYDMSYSFATEFNPSNVSEKLTESNTVVNGAPLTSKTYNDNSSYDKSSQDGTYVYELKQASVTITFTDDKFTVGAKEFFYLSFYINNELDKFGSTDVNVVTVDKNGTAKELKTYTSVTQEEGWNKVGILIKNNFESGNRTFEISLVLGPTDVKDVKYNSDFATGKVSVKGFSYVTGKTDKKDYVTPDYKDGTDNPEYKLYNTLLTSSAKATVALYAGNAADYNGGSDESNGYSFSYAPGDIGCIENAPTAANGYYGIVSNHVYIKENGAEEKTNTRTGNGDANGNVAGLINTKYLAKYATISGLAEIKEKLGFTDGDDDIQPLMIYTKDSDSYGFIGANQTIAASGYASVSVTLKAVDDAKAYIYLVDASGKTKNVMSFVDFTVNTDIVNGLNETKFEGENHKLQFTVDKNTENKDGWVTVTFYVATGATAKDFRVEIWNGDRNGENKSKGYVFVKDVTVTTSSAFSEPASWQQAFSSSGNPLYDAMKINLTELVAYERPLTATEKSFNKEYPDSAVSYSPTYVWAKSDTMLYAIYNTVDAVESNPYDGIEDEDDGAGCAAETDPSTFWLSFSSILLGVVLVLAIIALLVKTLRRKHLANKNDAKTQYKVKSRIDSHKENQKRIAKQTKDEEPVEETAIENDETVPVENEEEKASEQDLDSYVYGDVQDFGDAETNEEKPESDSSENEDK